MLGIITKTKLAIKINEILLYAIFEAENNIFSK